jgi:hypothetical protein
MGMRGGCKPAQERHERGKKTWKKKKGPGREALTGVSAAPALLSRHPHFISSCPRLQKSVRAQQRVISRSESLVTTVSAGQGSTRGRSSLPAAPDHTAALPLLPEPACCSSR